MESISTCEEEVFLSIYKLSPDDAALKQIMVTANKEFKHEWKPQTVSTFLARLVRKGYLTMIRRGRCCYYTPTILLEEYRLKNMNERIAILFGGDKIAFKKCLENMELLEK